MINICLSCYAIFKTKFFQFCWGLRLFVIFITVHISRYFIFGLTSTYINDINASLSMVMSYGNTKSIIAEDTKHRNLKNETRTTSKILELLKPLKIFFSFASLQ